MNVILFDGSNRADLLPFTFTRPVAEIRVGILTLREKWEHYLNLKTSTETEGYLAKKWPKTVKEVNVFINPCFFPSALLKKQILNLSRGEKLMYKDEVVAFKINGGKQIDSGQLNPIELKGKPLRIKNVWDIFLNNFEAIEKDFELLTVNRKSVALPSSVYAIGAKDIFIEEGAKIYGHCSLNAEEGPIYIGKNAQVWEGATVRGPFALGEKARVQMGTRVYPGTTAGPNSVIGGEVKNAVLFGNSNKGHDGYLGNSVIGEWCNLGADTNNSNLKNSYAEINLWNYRNHQFSPTGLQKCGLFMGDHSKSAINTMFNTGTVVGVNANVMDPEFPPNFIPSFTWGGRKNQQTYKKEKACKVAERVAQLAGKSFSKEDKAILNHVYALTESYR